VSVLVLTEPAPNEPLVLIPGFMADARSFMPQIARLGADRPVILLTPGLGDTLEKIAASIAPHLPPRFSLVAHGLGGNIAIEILRPDFDRSAA
jgi:pimeloyl-ACP methyl ester carboxylesterase